MRQSAVVDEEEEGDDELDGAVGAGENEQEDDEEEVVLYDEKAVEWMMQQLCMYQTRTALISNPLAAKVRHDKLVLRFLLTAIKRLLRCHVSSYGTELIYVDQRMGLSYRTYRVKLYIDYQYVVYQVQVRTLSVVQYLGAILGYHTLLHE